MSESSHKNHDSHIIRKLSGRRIDYYEGKNNTPPSIRKLSGKRIDYFEGKKESPSDISVIGVNSPPQISSEKSMDAEKREKSDMGTNIEAQFEDIEKLSMIKRRQIELMEKLAPPYVEPQKLVTKWVADPTKGGYGVYHKKRCYDRSNVDNIYASKK